MAGISAHQGAGDGIGYALDLHGIYEGPVGTDPYSGTIALRTS